MQLPVSPSL